MLNCSKILSTFSPIPLKEYGKRTPKLLISPNIQRVGRMQTAIETLRSISHPGDWRIGSNSRTWLKVQNNHSLTKRFKTP